MTNSVTPSPLPELIAAYRKAQSTYLDRPEDDDAGEWDAFQIAEEAFLSYPCHSLDDVRAKAEFIISDPNMLDTIKECTVIEGGEDCIALFLRSLLGPVDIGEN